MSQKEGSPVNLPMAGLFALVVALLVINSLAVLFDIPVLRQFSGFVFLTFVPGPLILYATKAVKFSVVEMIVLAIGTSIAFVTFFGLLMNNTLLAIGYSNPLSSIPLLIAFSFANIILAVLAYIRNKGEIISIPRLALSVNEKALLLVPATFPLLSVTGLRLMNSDNNNALLIILLLLIPAWVICLSVLNRNISERVYLLTIFMISISLTLLYSLRTNHIIGSDIHDLYYYFRATLASLSWRLIGPDLAESSLIASLFPAVYQQTLNIDPEYLYRVLFSLLFSISPLVVYTISRRYLGSFYSFLGAFFFMSQFYFPWTAGIANTSLAILFFALAMMTLFHDGISAISKRLLFIIFFASSLVSHYSVTYIFFFVLALTYAGLLIISKVKPIRKKIFMHSSNSAGDEQSFGMTALTVGTVALCFVMLFLWYSQITSVPFITAVRLIKTSLTSADALFELETRGPTVVAATGAGVSTIPQQIRFVSSWLSLGLIASGVLTTVVKYKSMLASTNFQQPSPEYLKSKFSVDFFGVVLACSVLLVFSVLLPYIQTTYSMERTFYQLTTVIAPFIVIGSISLAKLLKVRPYLLILLAVIPFFLSTTGVSYELLNQPASVILSSRATAHPGIMVRDQESYSAKWIKQYGGGALIYAGPALGTRTAVSQAVVHPSRVRNIVSVYERSDKIDGYIYLRNIDIVRDVLPKYPEIFDKRNKVYSAGISDVYR